MQVGTLPAAVAAATAIQDDGNYLLVAHRTGNVLDAVSRDGKHIGVLTVEGASTVDVRAIGDYTDRASHEYLVVADVGDETAFVVINRLDPPSFVVQQGSVLPLMKTKTAAQARITFDDGAHDVRTALFVTPDYDTLDVYLFTYEAARTRVYKANVTSWPGTATATLFRTLAAVGGASGLAVNTVLRNDTTAFVWPKGTVTDGSPPPCTFVLDARAPGAVAHARSVGTSGGLYAVGTTASSPILFYPPR